MKEVGEVGEDTPIIPLLGGFTGESHRLSIANRMWQGLFDLQSSPSNLAPPNTFENESVVSFGPSEAEPVVKQPGIGFGSQLITWLAAETATLFFEGKKNNSIKKYIFKKSYGKITQSGILRCVYYNVLTALLTEKTGPLHYLMCVLMMLIERTHNIRLGGYLYPSVCLYLRAALTLHFQKHKRSPTLYLSLILFMLFQRHCLW